jgi:hypothetical protein
MNIYNFSKIYLQLKGGNYDWNNKHE